MLLLLCLFFLCPFCPVHARQRLHTLYKVEEEEGEYVSSPFAKEKREGAVVPIVDGVGKEELVEKEEAEEKKKEGEEEKEGR